jgi:DNA replication protein DnaC
MTTLVHISLAKLMVKRLIAKAKFPVLKTIDTFDFSAQPDLPKHKILGLVDASFVRSRETVLFIGKPGTGNYAK